MVYFETLEQKNRTTNEASSWENTEEPPGKYQASSNGLAAACDVTAALSKLSAARPTAQSAPENLLTVPKSMRKEGLQKDSRLFEHSAGKDAHQRSRYVWQNVTIFYSSALPLAFTSFLPCARVFYERDSC